MPKNNLLYNNQENIAGQCYLQFFISLTVFSVQNCMTKIVKIALILYS